MNPVIKKVTQSVMTAIMHGVIMWIGVWQTARAEEVYMKVIGSLIIIFAIASIWIRLERLMVRTEEDEP